MYQVLYYCASPEGLETKTIFTRDFLKVHPPRSKLKDKKKYIYISTKTMFDVKLFNIMNYVLQLKLKVPDVYRLHKVGVWNMDCIFSSFKFSK